MADFPGRAEGCAARPLRVLSPDALGCRLPARPLPKRVLYMSSADHFSDDSEQGLRHRIAGQAEDAIGRLADDLIENPVINSALSRAPVRAREGFAGTAVRDGCAQPAHCVGAGEAEPAAAHDLPAPRGGGGRGGQDRCAPRDHERRGTRSEREARRPARPGRAHGSTSSAATSARFAVTSRVSLRRSCRKVRSKRRAGSKAIAFIDHPAEVHHRQASEVIEVIEHRPKPAGATRRRLRAARRRAHRAHDTRLSGSHARPCSGGRGRGRQPRQQTAARAGRGVRDRPTPAGGGGGERERPSARGTSRPG